MKGTLTRVVELAWGALVAKPGSLLAASLAIGFTGALILGWGMAMVYIAGVPAYPWLYFGVLGLGWGLIFLTQACAVTLIASRQIAGEPVEIGRILIRAVVKAFPVLIIAVLFLAGTAACGVLLVVPGLVFIATFSVVIPVYLCEATSLSGAFVRSRALTRGRRIALLALWAAALAVAALSGWLFVLVAAGIGYVLGSFMLGLCAFALIATVNAVLALLNAAVHATLCDQKDGRAVEAVFE